MKLTPKSLKTLSMIFLGLAIFSLGFTIAYEWRSENKLFYLGLPITLPLALISVFLGIASKKKKDQ